MTAVYNEHDPYAAQWVRNLIRAGHIAPGDVDERSIEDVHPDDYRKYTQVHLFAGLGGWSYSLRRAGWDDDRGIWSISCPCQPFSAAGKGMGVADERHLWPAAFHLIQQLEPERIVGEQVASPDGLAWLDIVHSDLEATNHAFAAVDFCSAGVGAPHIRQRLYWVANASSGEQRRLRERGSHFGMSDRRHGSTQRVEYPTRDGREPWGTEPGERSVTGGCGDGFVGNPIHTGLEGHAGHGHDGSGRPGTPGPVAPPRMLGGLADGHQHGRLEAGYGSAASGNDGTQRDGASRGMGDAERIGTRRNPGASAETQSGAGVWPIGDHARPPSAVGGMEHPGDGHLGGAGTAGDDRLRDMAARPGPTNGLWGNADWLFCRDGKWRPVESRTQPLAHGAPSRVGRLRAYGNAINVAQAEIFLRAALD